MTFNQATAAHLAKLSTLGWTVKSALKVPHATSPDGLTRLWFKPQAVYAGRGTDLGSARSLHSDTRTASTEQLMSEGAKLAADLAAQPAW